MMLLALSSSCLAQPEAGGAAAAESPGAASLAAITHVNLVDVERGVVEPDQTILMNGPRISRVGASSEVVVPAGASVLDAKGLYAMPGLCDAHIHSAMTTDLNGKLFLANGVTLVRDMGGMTPTMVAIRKKYNEQGNAGFVPDPDFPVVGPFMVVTGNIVDGKPPVWAMFSEVATTPEEARAAVRKLHGAGVDQIKVYSRLRPEVYAAACEEAKAVGLKAVGHIPGQVTLEQAIAAGQHTNEHLQRLDLLIREALPAEDVAKIEEGGTIDTRGWPKTYWAHYPKADRGKLRAGIERLKASGMVQVPTLVVLQGIVGLTDLEAAQKDPRLVYTPAFSQQFWMGPGYKGYAGRLKEELPHFFSLARDLREAGVPMIVGTDLANPFVFAGFSVHDELKNFVEIGFTAGEALRAATIAPARALGVDADHGTIALGKYANVVLVRSDPLSDISHAGQIEHVVIAGRHHDRAALDRLMEEVKEQAGN